MIRVMGRYLEGVPFNLSVKEEEILNHLQNSSFIYDYSSLRDLRFELHLRSKIIEAAIQLGRSGAEFTVFKYSRFNPLYWTKTSRGYVLKPNVLPSVAINDVFINGQEYAFECSTAIVLIYYYAVLKSINEVYFNQLFQSLLVWDWSYDEDLGIITKVGTDFIPGDVMYFYNPDYENPVWIGENVVFLGNGLYFGHGVGSKTAEGMIEALNTLRKSNATRSAHLIPQHSRLNFQYLSQFAR
ncbi:protein-glutamine gamma-glutamyltransferase [Bacillus sp. 31A1R]|uniref:Protein-glutamine gamma-glutamyltransferase n=1 Tax=Robertmurraya mangrovi TaxID=3098077 RepID=A0ABU5ITK4_9BACI|nr:protein-glutamine gamma-glutamyltransferase [Bacillus sp. 31A1R]MDZ5470484.1 protein-glutamine gamma-glutamyltransferase [Bacillus sp. 31A1R]